MSAIIEFGFNAAAVDRGLAQLQTKISGFGASAAKAMPNLSGMLGIGALGTAIKGTLSHFDDLADTALKLGESTATIQRVTFAAEQSGTTMEGVAGSALKLEKALGDVENTKAAEALAHLGITGQSLAAMPLDEKLIALSGAFGEARASGTGYNDILNLLGKSAGDLIPLFSAGKEGLEAMFNKAPVLADEAVQRMAAMNDQVDGVVSHVKAGFGAIIAAGMGLKDMAFGASFGDAFGSSDATALEAGKRERDRAATAAAQEKNRVAAAAAAQEKEDAKNAAAAAKEKETALTRVKAIQESITQQAISRMAPEQKLAALADLQKQKIDEMRAAGGLFYEATVQGMEAFAASQLKGGVSGVDKTFDKLQEVLKLQAQMDATQGGMRDQAATDSGAAAEKEKAAKAAEKEAWWEQTITMEKEKQDQLSASRDLAGEMALLQAKANGQEDLVKQLEREEAIRQRTAAIMAQTGLGKDQATAAATKMQNLQEAVDKRGPSSPGDKSTAAADGKIKGYSFAKQGGAYQRQEHLYSGDPNRPQNNPLAGKAAAAGAEKGGQGESTTTQTALQVIQQILSTLTGAS